MSTRTERASLKREIMAEVERRLAGPGPAVTGDVTDLDPGTMANGEFLANVGGTLVGASPTAGGIHHTTHEFGGTDVVSVDGLSGLLADPQNPVIGATSTTAVAGNDARLTDARAALAHKVTHENGGIDEISVVGLSGVLADPQHPIIGSGATEAVAGTDARLTNARTPSPHVIATNLGLGAEHTISGAAAGSALMASSATAANFRPIVVADLPTGSSSSTVALGNDSRFTDARTPLAHATSHQPGGTDAMAVDAAAGTGSLRTLGTSATSAAAGNDSRLSDARTPTSHASSHQPGGADAMAVDAVAATGSLRTLGTGATQAAAGNHGHAQSDITGLVAALGGKESTANKAVAGGYASLDGAGKVPSAQLPSLAITDTFVVASQAAMLALSSADVGDLAVRTDVSKTYILTALPYSTLGNWQELLTPTGAGGGVSSVNGQTGTVSLIAANIPYAGSTNLSSTDVEAALDELDTEKVPATRTLSTTAPLTGGGDLSTNRTLAVSAATTTTTGVVELATDSEVAAGVVVQGNDSRLSNSRTPTAHVLNSASHTASGLTIGWVLRATGTTSFDFQALIAADIPTLDAAKIGTGRFIAARHLDGSDGFLLMAKGAGLDPAYTSRIAARLTADNTAIAGAVPTTAVVVANLVVPVVVGGEYDVEWELHLANSIAADVFVFNVLPSAGAFTGRVTIDGANGVPTSGAAVVKKLMGPAGTLTVASANAPGNTGTIGLITSVRVRAQGIQSVAPGNLQVAIRAGTSAAATSGTATVKARSQVIARRAA